ncbi:site-2 protease family protein [Candidatus Azambacteria bacterium]|nr:site-2 protease family protein [Candidatus Azambacteria bacterium]
MLLFQLFADNPTLIIPWLFALLIAITIHEVAHGYAAYKLGDETAFSMGRLTLNPLAHLDVLGSLMLVLVGFGWAKPVPVNIANVQRGNFGKFLVSFAGILANVVIAVFAIIFLKIVLSAGLSEVNFLVKFLAFLTYINLSLFVFNLLPIAPLDGYRIFETFAPRAFERFAPFMEQWGFFILLAVVFLTNIIGILIYSFINFFSWLFSVPIIYLAFGGM